MKGQGVNGFTIQNPETGERSARKHPTFRKRYDRFVGLLEHCSATNVSELQRFGLACELLQLGNGFDLVKVKFGNEFRIVATFTWSPRRVYLWFVGTHAEYDKLGDVTKKKWTANGLS
jgi:mRNA-degrading endonuclease HigB of HigAB toxin-antitoxin module